MCGIAGHSTTGRVGDIAGAMAAMAHRGPDDSGRLLDQDAGVGLGHLRLSIIDLSPLGHQPMHSIDGRFAIVYNGELFNFRELRRELEAKGHRFRSHSDTEVVLEGYRAWGPELLPRLNGMFALAIFDKTEGTLLVARDALGVKPLYVAQSQGSFAFASELKGLLPLVPGSREIDVVSIHRYLSFLWCPGAGTPLKGARKLGPGEAVLVRRGSVLRQWTWYRLPAFRPPEAPVTGSAAITGVAEQLRGAVRRQMVADVPVGAFLSGGLDSSALVTFAREVAPDIRCFTIETDGGGDAGMTDDLPYARRVATHLNVPLDVLPVDSRSMAADLAKMVEQLDEPLADLSSNASQEAPA